MILPEERDFIRDFRELLLWTKVAHFDAVKKTLSEALDDQKSRLVYQLCDGTKSHDQIRKECKVSPNFVTGVLQRCVPRGLMTVTEEGRRVRAFDLAVFGLVEEDK